MNPRRLAGAFLAALVLNLGFAAQASRCVGRHDSTRPAGHEHRGGAHHSIPGDRHHGGPAIPACCDALPSWSVSIQAQQMVTPLGIPMKRMGSGTTWIPDATPLPSREGMAGSWFLMVHGFGFVQYDAQGGSRGDEQFGSLNWGMLMASRDLAGGRF